MYFVSVTNRDDQGTLNPASIRSKYLRTCFHAKTSKPPGPGARHNILILLRKLERANGFEPSTLTLGKIRVELSRSIGHCVVQMFGLQVRIAT